MRKDNIYLSKTATKKPRLQKASELIKRTLAEILISRNFSDSNGNSFMIFVSEVSLSPDLKNAKVFLSKFSKSNDISDECVLKEINTDLPKISRELARKIELRFTPKLHFEIDKVGKNSDKVELLLKRLDNIN